MREPSDDDPPPPPAPRLPRRMPMRPRSARRTGDDESNAQAPTPRKKAGGDTGMSGGKLIAIVAGAFVGLFALTLLLVYLVSRGGNTSGEQAKAPPAEPEATKTSAPPAKAKAAPASATKADPARALLDEYDAYARSQPHNFVERATRLEKITAKFETEDWARHIQSRQKAIREDAEQRGKELAESLGKAAEKKADANDIKGAFAELDKFPPELAKTIASNRILYFRRKINDSAKERFAAAEKRAATLLEAKDFDGAARAFEALSVFDNAEVKRMVTARKAEIADAQKRGVNPSAGKDAKLKERQAFYGADVYVALDGMAAKFESACREAINGETEKALEQCDVTAWPRSAIFHFARAIALARDGNAEEARWCLEQARRLGAGGDKGGNAFASRLLCAEVQVKAAESKEPDYEKLLAKCDEAAALDEKNALAHFMKGSLYYRASQDNWQGATKYNEHVANAQKAFAKAGELDPAYGGFASAQNVAKPVVPDKYAVKGMGNPALASVVMVTGSKGFGTGHGSGFAVKSDAKRAYIITNHHVIDGLEKMEVIYQYEAEGTLARKESKKVKVLADDPDNDLALLEVETEHLIKPLALRPTVSGLNELTKLVLIGHPKHLDFTIMSGELASRNRVEHGKRFLQVNANVDSGMSGGPVIDEQGLVVGVTVAKYNDVAGQGLAILSEHVRDICEQAKVEVKMTGGK